MSKLRHRGLNRSEVFFADVGLMRRETPLLVGGGLITDICGTACALYRRSTAYALRVVSGFKRWAREGRRGRILQSCDYHRLSTRSFCHSSPDLSWILYMCSKVASLSCAVLEHRQLNPRALASPRCMFLNVSNISNNEHDRRVPCRNRVGLLHRVVVAQRESISRYVRLPTTLIGMIDAAIAIKVGGNLAEKHKNRIGAFHPHSGARAQMRCVAVSQIDHVHVSGV